MLAPRLIGTPAHQGGLTLIELMVALTLGLILTAAATQVFVANKATYRLTQALSQVQENGRFAMQQMAYDLRMAGYLGCKSRRQPEITVVANNAPPIVKADSALLGFNKGSGWWTAASSPLDQAGNTLTICNAANKDSASCRISDVVQIIRASEAAAPLAVDMANAGDDLVITKAEFNSMRPTPVVADDEPDEEDLLLVTDCEAADVFRATSINAVGGNYVIKPNAPLGKPPFGNRYIAAAQGAPILQTLIGASYFVADPGIDSDGDGVVDPLAALYRIGFADEGTIPAAVPVAEGVEKMQITYGVNRTGDESADEYVNAAALAAAEWSKVVSVRVALLIKSKENWVTDEPVPVTFVDGTVVNGVGSPERDRRLRLVFSQTIGIRNRVQ